MSIQSCFVLLLVAWIPPTCPVSAQQAVAPAQATTAIHLNVAVTERSGAPVRGLTQREFTLTDNKESPPITSFHEVTAAAEPVRILLVLDAVNTRFTEVAYEQGQLQKFLKSNGGKLPYPTNLAVVTDTGIESEPTFTTDGNALSASLNHFSAPLRDIRRGAGIYGADERLDLSLKSMQQLTSYAATLPGRKILIWLSPGWPLLSGPGIQLDGKQQRQIFANIVSFSTQLRQANVTLYSVNPLGATEGVFRANYYEEFVKGIATPARVDLGDLALPVLALQSGGLALQASTDVSHMIRQCFDDLSSWYEISFDGGPVEGSEVYHHIEVRVSAPGAIVHTRDGYYTPSALSGSR